MREANFNAIFEELTPRQRKVLQGFLAGETDEAIATTLCVEPSTIRRHLANIHKEFGLSNLEGEHYSRRDELIELFTRYKPEVVNPGLVSGKGGRSPDLDFPGSPLSSESPLYIERPPIEARCAKEILKPGALIRIRAPKQMGKTSLLNRIIASAEAVGYQALRLNLRQAEEQFLTSLDTFLRWFCITVNHKLNLPVQLDEYWDDRFGSMVSCTTYFQAHILGQLDRCLLLGLDEVDWLFEAPKIAQGFFALLRSWHEEANNLDIWQRLRLVVAHSTEVYIPLNIHQSPFNVGLPIRLTELTVSQVQTLAGQYGLYRLSSAEIEQLTALVGGHPYLIQLALYHLQKGETSLNHLLQTAATQSGIYSSDLRRQWQTLRSHPELMQSFKAVIETKEASRPLDPILAYRLESMGLVRLQGNQISISCELYQQFFEEQL
ncbi:AAA-like domain-containing protein [Cyanobacteria bacterium FACHB-471]|nr:AAA-like domain-containing protein [Cyanobacteria bacterium FACHB-471]